MLKMKWLGALLAVLVLAVTVAPSTNAVSTTTMKLEFTGDQLEARVDGTAVALEVPAVVQNGEAYVPAAFLAEKLNIKLTWNSKTQRVDMPLNASVKVEFDIANNLAYINNVSSPLDKLGTLVDGRLLFKLSWIGSFVGAKWEFQAASKTMNITYVQTPQGLYNAGSDNSQPVAKFTFAKSSYRIGEPIKYVDLSYDPDAEGLAKYEWSANKQDVYFKAGQYPITLKVTDAGGRQSAVYTRTLTIVPATYLDDLSYRLQYTPVGESFKTNWDEYWARFRELPELNKQVTMDKSRKLIVSDSPETIKGKGILYQEVVNGKARLYADHVNGSDQKVMFTIFARNMTNKPVTVKTTNKGEVYPSIYANIIGNEASIDFMLHDPVQDKPLVLQPGQSNVYVMMPEFFPGQGVNVFYDVETDGDVQFSFLAMDNVSTPTDFSNILYGPLPFSGNVRGTFEAADKTWNLNLSDLTKPSMIMLGDGTRDQYVEGYDTFRKQQVKNEGNYGMIYHIHADKPKRMVVLLIARGGVFKGPFKVGGEFVMVPRSGTLPAFEQVFVLARTTGTEDSLDIEWTPPAGSAFPVDVIFYPLDEVKQ